MLFGPGARGSIYAHAALGTSTTIPMAYPHIFFFYFLQGESIVVSSVLLVVGDATHRFLLLVLSFSSSSYTDGSEVMILSR